MYLQEMKKQIEQVLNDKYLLSIVLQINLKEDKFDFFTFV